MDDVNGQSQAPLCLNYFTPKWLNSMGKNFLACLVRDVEDNDVQDTGANNAKCMTEASPG